MIFRQFLHRDPIAVSYLFGCGSKAAGVVVDPVGETSLYMTESEARGLRIRYVIDTHIHADHISSARHLAALAGAEYVLFRDAAATFAFKGVSEGDVLEVGNTEIRVMHTPGHTPEHISLVVTDRVRADEPWFVVTGHTLMVGDLGRTELASSAEAGARELFRSAEALRALPDHIEVMPGAYSGSVCGRSLSGKPSSTIGFERRHNKAFAILNEQEFVRFMLRDIPPPPPDAAAIRAENSGTEVVAA